MWDRRTDRTLAARHASYAVLAATARIGARAAIGIPLDHWRPDEALCTIRGIDFPLLPIAIDIVGDFLELRVREWGACEDWLFVKKDGSQISEDYLYRKLQNLGKKLGLPGNDLLTRLHDAFDRCFDGEADRAAVVALRGSRDGAIDVEVEDRAIEDAAADTDRLLCVLRRNHPLDGPAGRFTGLRAAKLIKAGPCNLPRARPKDASPALDSHPLCLRILAEEGPARGQPGFTGHVRKMKKKYFEDVDALRTAGILNMRDIAFLFDVPRINVDQWYAAARKRVLTDEERRAETALRAEMVAAYRERPKGLDLKLFAQAFERDRRPGKNWFWYVSVLRLAGEIRNGPGRPRGRGRAA
jgi:hypothetical protein